MVSDWGWWLEHYPGAVAYHLFDKYQPVDLPAGENADAVKSRGKPDARLQADAEVLGVWTGKHARAYRRPDLEKAGLLAETVDGEPLVMLWEPATKTAAAYRPVVAQPRKFKGPQPDAAGVSPPDAGVPVPPGTPVMPARKVTLALAPANSPGRFRDTETGSFWDVAGRCVAGALKGYTLEWVDSVQVKWFAWAAEYPDTSVFEGAKAARADAGKAAKAIAGTAEFLRLLPKPFATVQAVDPAARTVTLLADSEQSPRTWPLEPDAEVKVGGWWGRLEQLRPGDRVWAWLKLDRKRQPVAVVMLADGLSEWDMHGSLLPRAGKKPAFTPEAVESARRRQRDWLRARWEAEGLPGTLTFCHVFSGELELTLDHEAMRWARGLKAGDVVHLQADPPIKAVVRHVTPWRERTVVRLVAGELESADLRIGQRLALRVPSPPPAVDADRYPPDLDRPRSKAERVEWFLASTYCTCGIAKDICTGHFYTLASCNPNGCGMPNARRQAIGEMIDQGKSDRAILDELLKESGPLLLRPHLMP